MKAANNKLFLVSFLSHNKSGESTFFVFNTFPVLRLAFYAAIVKCKILATNYRHIPLVEGEELIFYCSCSCLHQRILQGTYSLHFNKLHPSVIGLAFCGCVFIYRSAFAFTICFYITCADSEFANKITFNRGSPAF